MAAGKLRAVVATSTLDLGIDWGDVDLVIHLGAPKGASRLLQRIGRANHRLDEPSRAILVPGNRFEVLECRAAQQAAEAGAQDAVLSRSGALDVLAQHILGMACQAPFDPDTLFAEVRSALPYAGLTRRQFDRTVEFVSTGGYALKAYERFAKLRPAEDGRLRVANPRIAQQYRLNVGTIVDSPMLKVRLVSVRARQRFRAARRSRSGRGRRIFRRAADARSNVRLRRRGPALRRPARHGSIRLACIRRRSDDPELRRRQVSDVDASCRARARDARRSRVPGPGCRSLSRTGSRLQTERSVIPAPDEVLVETFPRGGRHFLVAYPFEGRLAHQTLGMLLTRRLDRAGAKPLGLRCQRLRARRLGAWRHFRADRRAAGYRSPNSSTRTCSATISTPGSPKAA